MLWQVLSADKGEGWFVSTEAMQIDGVGCIVRVSSGHQGAVSEALTFVPNAKVIPDGVGGRKLQRM